MNYFTRSEFACKCGCGFDTVDYRLWSYLTQIRENFGVPVTVTSAARCYEYNRSKAVGSNDRSQHPKGRAADLQVKGVSPQRVADFACSLGIPGVGRYKTFTHIDTRSGRKARWSNL